MLYETKSIPVLCLWFSYLSLSHSGDAQPSDPPTDKPGMSYSDAGSAQEPVTKPDPKAQKPYYYVVCERLGFVYDVYVPGKLPGNQCEVYVNKNPQPSWAS